MTIRVGRIPYLNSEPFYYKLDREDIELVTLVPRALAQAVEEGTIDAGPIPVVDFFRLQDKVNQIGQFCISTIGKSRSVFFYSKGPIEALDGATIGIIDDTSTSKRLLEVLLTQVYHVKPENYVSQREPNDAVLLIGDEALRSRRGIPGYEYQYDLGEEWYKWTKMPFVFAVWVAQESLPQDRASYLENVLYTCVDVGLDHMSMISQMRQDIGMSLRETMEYFQGYRYWAGVAEQKAMWHFKECLYSMNNTRPS